MVDVLRYFLEMGTLHLSSAIAFLTLKGFEELVVIQRLEACGHYSCKRCRRAGKLGVLSGFLLKSGSILVL